MKLRNLLLSAIVVTAGLMLAGAAAAQSPCIEPDNGSGTVTLPPAGCEYLSPDQVHLIIDGLPPGTQIILAPIHKDFICHKTGTPSPICNTPGGPLSGEVEDFDSKVVFQVSGTGALAGWTRILTIPLAVRVASGPRTLGASVQSFNADMLSIQGGITGDPDFASISIVGGTSNGMSSPGKTTLTRLSGEKTWRVDSLFTVSYKISFVGASGGALAGWRGTTAGSVKMQAFQ